MRLLLADRSVHLEATTGREKKVVLSPQQMIFYRSIQREVRPS